MKTCIACAEEIQSAALLCRHCGTDQRDARFSDLASIDKTEAARQPEQGPEGDSARPTLDNPVTNWAKGLLGRIENPESLFKDALKSLSNLWVDISVYLEKVVSTPSSRKVLGIAAVAMGGVLLIAALTLGQARPTGGQTPQKSVGEQSYEFGVEVGKGLARQNRALFPDEDGQCSSAFNYHAGSRDLDFDRFFVGCKTGWNLSKNR